MSLVEGLSSAALIELIQQHGVIAVIIGALLEEIVVPVPSPVVPLAGGALLVTGSDPVSAFFQVLLIVAIPASVASVLSSYFVFSIAFFGGKPAVDRYGWLLDFTWEELEALEDQFGDEREKYMVAGLRAVPVVPLSLISGAAGLFRMDWKSYGLWSFAGMVPRNLVLGMAGWLFADRFRQVAGRIDSLSTGIALIVAGAVGAYFLYRFVDRRVRSWLVS